MGAFLNWDGGSFPKLVNGVPPLAIAGSPRCCAAFLMFGLYPMGHSNAGYKTAYILFICRAEWLVLGTAVGVFNKVASFR